ncbi:branched-chain amino acid aminotransferase [Algoriphagus yeomjeoni]|uniref:branched-chain-amino-acid transaminase n=2 Tax=Algoriphagus yeomjeoni TaxID=291403 RepID=A0A327PPE1_9BACT|nr:branched-chain amino acid aminotransferase [Algoriphagus yeomjeoni]
MIEIDTIFTNSLSGNDWVFLDSSEIPNRAMNFGDGLFETMVWDFKEIRFFEKHLKRLSGGMQLLNLDDSSINAEGLVQFLASNFPNQRKRVRWNVYRSGQGKYTPEGNEVKQMLQISEFKPAPKIKKKVDVSLKTQLFPNSWSAFKTLNALPYVLANQERKDRGLDEIILLDHRGYISESGASNIFWVKDKVVFTPALSCSCINGVSRQVILDYLVLKNIPFEEGEFLPSELEAADQAFISNCTGISYLESYNKTLFSTIPLQHLNDLFE